MTIRQKVIVMSFSFIRVASWVAALTVASCARGVPAAITQAREAGTCCPDRIVREGLQFTAKAQIDSLNGPPQLVWYIHVFNPTDTTAGFASTSEQTCIPPLHLVSTATGRSHVWSFPAWARARDSASYGGSSHLVCIGTALEPRLPRWASVDVARHAFPVAMIRGDSIAAGSYRIGVVIRFDSRPGENLRGDSIVVWTLPVALP
jgi:hypothetical protein